MSDITLKTIITQHIHLQPPNHKGWQAVRCHVCNDHTRKGLRGAFLFDGDNVIYKCWNCSIVATYKPLEHESFTKNMRTVLTAFNIPESEYLQVILTSPAYLNGGKKLEAQDQPLKGIEPKEVAMPSFFYFLKTADENDEIAKEAREYLIKERGVNPDDYPFMLATKAKNPKLHKWLGRVIMPIFKNEKLIFYTGRALYDATKKYETPATPKEKVLYGFDRLFEHTQSPLLVAEGWFDAFAVDGVATLGNVITPYQIEWLNRSPREKIYIPDKFGDGKHAAQQALKQGWYISTPDIGQNCKDMSDAVKKYGKLYVLKSIMDNKAKGFAAEVQLQNYCD